MCRLPLSQTQTRDLLEVEKCCSIVLYGAAKDILLKMDNIEDLQVFLEQMRYESFVKVTPKNNAVKLSSLVPTVDALSEHTKGCYLQIQV
ncbi:unnamed protein product [Arctia plantaginis]|uniref:Uncharacterized protein n=1 Tax=Arctia plantaginis TaxID=874455 RepID=A0A8S0ZCZ4_ARCPL|nr:unnamed protein product [Arctia plantaginis]